MRESFLGFSTDKKWDYENGYYLTSDVTRLGKIIAHYELYKSIIGLHGHVVECGVYKGASFIRWATFREVLESPRSRKIIGFDAFGAFPNVEREDDQEFIEKFEAAGGKGPSKEEFEAVLANKDFKNFELVQGDICKTLPEYIIANPELRVSLLHIDVDVYKPTKVILEQLYERIVPGGVLVLDDYGLVAGETDAVDEYFDGSVLIEKSPTNHVPAYIRKPLKP